MVRIMLAVVLTIGLGGGAIALTSDDAAFSRPVAGLDRETLIGVGLGRRLFRHVWPPARPGADRLDGLCPVAKLCFARYFKKNKRRIVMSERNPLRLEVFIDYT